ncbi:MAG: AAA family ATPase [Oscillospiraceae bacterium]|nr:AAA family ATPase [Oscillospiraceae bacterium]
MNNHTLHTYRNLAELRKIQEEREVFPFIFSETKDRIECCSEICIDISALVYYLSINKSNIEPIYINFTSMDEDTLVIVEDNLAESAIELLPLLFYEYSPYFDNDNKTISDSKEIIELKPCPRRKIFEYNNVQDLEEIIQYAEINNIPIATFSRANGDLRKEFEQFNASCELSLLDLTSVSYVIENNKSLIYSLEQFLGAMLNIRVIAQTSQIDILLNYLPLFFDGQEPIRELIPDLPGIDVDLPGNGSVMRVIDLCENDFENLIDTFNHNLIGHGYFKKRLEHSLRNFAILNKANEQKVFSIFLFGISGIGKTEVARLLANGLKEDCYLGKINFQNYSSQDALNSLIGSPAGYVGCNHGELSEKIQKSEVGVLLCDEFEKTNRPVFSFFLELLEEGRFTDSMAREYDLDGYVIIFTSNIQNEAEYKKTIPPELQTRFDLVCEFEEPTSDEKTEFLNLLLEKAYQKYPEEFATFELTEQDKRSLYDFDYRSLSALRDIKREFNNRLVDLFSSKGIL